MKTLVLANQKGGVGKSAVAVQLAYYLHVQAGYRVLFIDFDHQRNSTKAIAKGGLATVSSVTASDILSQQTILTEDTDDFVLLPADNEALMKMERQADKHNAFASSLHHFVNSHDDRFDICIIDTNPNPDIRQLASLVVADFVLSPIQLNQEAIDGIGDLLNHPTIGIRKIKATINPNIELLGILPNLVEPTPFQRENFRDLSEHFGKLLIKMDKGYALIKKTTSIPEAQSAGIPVWDIKKTSARNAWRQIEPVFKTITKMMEI